MARLSVQTALLVAAVGTLLFVPAGTLAWPGAWVFLAELGGAGLTIGLWLANHDPALLRERLAPPLRRAQPTWDRVLVTIMVVLWTAWIVLMGVDAGRARTVQVPLAARALGALGPALSFYVGYLTFRENTWASPVVRIQTERVHRLVATGPYRWVRHPMYAGTLFFFLGTPLLLGSWLGLALAPVMIAVLAVRAVLEERALTDALAGYREYAARVRYRLIPRVW